MLGGREKLVSRIQLSTTLEVLLDSAHFRNTGAQCPALPLLESLFEFHSAGTVLFL